MRADRMRMDRVHRNVKAIARDVLINGAINGPLCPRNVRGRLWGMIGHSVAPTASINADCFLGAANGLTLGERAFINYGCFFDLCAPTTIGADCSIGYQAMFVTCSHDLDTPGAGRAGAVVTAPITVGDGCWLGARVTVLPGVEIGKRCVVAAGSVVAADCEPGCLYGGVPARLIRRLP
ncbi:acyltransferase [Actinotalea ferrariae]|uniref:acyltransferase n=1 Tax=Actinotalea ferrariae TaxID=1386098 RepID=UPI0012DC1FB0